MTIQELNRELGNVDLFLLDQILKGRFEKSERVLEAGCGEGRNLTYFIRNDYDVWGIDNNPLALKMLRMTGRSLHKNFDPEKFIATDITELPFPPQSFDAIICLSVLHFSSSEEAFFSAFDAIMQVLRKDGFLCLSMLSKMDQTEATISDENRPNDRFFLTTSLYNTILQKYNLQEEEPAKTVVVKGGPTLTYLMLKKAE